MRISRAACLGVIFALVASIPPCEVSGASFIPATVIDLITDFVIANLNAKYRLDAHPVLHQAVAFDFDPEDLHVFDSDSGRSLRP